MLISLFLVCSLVQQMSTVLKGVLSEHEHFPSGASGQSSLEYKCAYLCIYIRKSSLDYDSIKIFIKISCILAITHGNCNHSVPMLGGITI